MMKQYLSEHDCRKGFDTLVILGLAKCILGAIALAVLASTLSHCAPEHIPEHVPCWPEDQMNREIRDKTYGADDVREYFGLDWPMEFHTH